jgi:hypothetical protein
MQSLPSAIQIEKNVMGMTCDNYSWHERCIKSFGGET